MMLVAALCCGFSACDELPQEEEQNQTEQPETPDAPSTPEIPDTPDTPGTDTPDVTSGIYKEVKETYSDWSGNYLITYTTSETVTVFNAWDEDTYGQSSKDIISAKTADGISSAEGDPHMSVVTKVGDYYSINVSNVGYIGYEGSKNSLSRTSTEPKSTDTHYLWKLSYKEGGDVWVRNAAVDSRRLQWNSNHPRFACYTGSQQELTLYRRSVSTGSNPPSADPGPDDPEVPDTPAPNPDPDPVPDPNPDPDPVPDPTPEPEPDPEPDPGQGTSGLHSWYELPVMDLKSSGKYLVDANDSDLYYAYHMCAGNEKGPGGKKARNYTVCYSAEHHCPVWVAAPRHKMYESGASRTDAYGKDPDIPSDIQYNSKSTGGSCNKGHMLGSAERLSSTATNKQVFYYTNIAPQYSSTFNTGGGGWNTLEDWVDGQVCSDTLYVVIGTYFKSYTDRRGYSDSPKTISFGGRSDVTRPSMFYYILLRTKKGNSGKPLSQCSASEIKCAAFVRSHATPKGVKVSEKDLMSVSDLERLTGFTYFPNVPQAVKNSYNASDWGL